MTVAGAQAFVATAVQAFGGLDILVCNAGIRPPVLAELQELPLDMFRYVMGVNFYGNLHVIHAALPHLLAADRGRIIATTSSAEFIASPTNSMYAVSKTALIGLIRAVGAEGAAKGLRANLISPIAMTPMSEGDLDARFTSQFDQDHVAKVVGWLASPKCDLNGEILVAGGDRVYRATVDQTQGQPIGNGNFRENLDALLDLSQLVELRHGLVAEQKLMREYDAANPTARSLSTTPLYRISLRQIGAG